MDAPEYLGKILGVSPQTLESLDRAMAKRTGREGILARVAEENEERIAATFKILDLENRSAETIREAMKNAVLIHERQLLDFLDAADSSSQILQGETWEDKSEFDRAAILAKKIAKSEKGFFLKRSFAEEIFKKRTPENLLRYLGYGDVPELLAKHDVLEAFSALRFVESDQWMHETFDAAYGGFTADDFEERDIEIKVLGPEWHEIAQKFVAKKHHNVSHLKEFGVIFINPIKEDVAGKFLRDFALLLHYFHEIEFYSKLFRKYANAPDFASKLKALLRGDVQEIKAGEGSPSQVSQSETWEGNWLIVQRYLFKEDPADPRLLLPRVNPESLHWLRGERDLALFGGAGEKLNLKLWHDLDWVGGVFDNDHKDDNDKNNEDIVSFDLEDNAMSAVSFAEGKNELFNYHQREAMWTKIFMEYAGGEEAMEQLLIENFSSGVVSF
ncbi:MAG: hypothetical protein A2122_01665 [Candidatus Liptonbacteria bacterium GWB1_49_6]|uniref:Uncharacterized protein n=1 Tax=Candidatus Liptonbacteria bacterium GWB1_49_6 TaxID=1798644 RepID=A0A1G2C498_9BACT|nr:MAG: hypothetical protein A2122_01665 [Candidatus Liptonbacteria bacterium GWB1_49_6]